MLASESAQFDSGMLTISTGSVSQYEMSGPEVSAAARDVTITMTSHAPRARLATHSSANPYLSIVLSGDYCEHIGSAVVSCMPMEMRFHPAGEEHSHVMGSDGARCMIVLLGDAWCDSTDSLSSALTTPLLVRAPGWWPTAVISRSRSPEDASELLESWTTALLELCERQARVERAAEKSQRIRRVIESIDERLDQRLTLTGLAKEAGLHPTHLARSFRSLTGYSVGEYVRKQRIARAQQLLVSERSFSLSRIAVESGFFDHAHLTRSFRRTLGVPPSELRSVLERTRIFEREH